MLWAPAKYSQLGGRRDSVAASNFIARALAVNPSLDATHQNNLKTLLNGLTADGLFNPDGTSSYFDLLYILGTQDSATALLNLVSSSFTGVANGSPPFTSDRGYTGTDLSATIYINTQFNPATASSPKYTANSAHLSVWTVNNITGAGAPVGGYQDYTTVGSIVLPRYTSNSLSYFRTNDVQPGESGGVAGLGVGNGHFLGNRSGSSTQQGYQNATDLGMTAVASAGVPNINFGVLCQNDGPGRYGSPWQVAAASFGASLTSTQVTNFYNRLRTYMTAVGVP